MVALEADADLQVRVPGGARRREDAPDSGRVDRDRLLHEHVLPARDGVLEVDRTESGWCREDHEVEVEIHHLLIRVEAGEASLGRYVEQVSPLLSERLRQSLVAGLDAITEHVAHRDQFDVQRDRFGLNQESHTGIAWTGPDEATVIRRATAWVKRKAEILE